MDHRKFGGAVRLQARWLRRSCLRPVSSSGFGRSLLLKREAAAPGVEPGNCDGLSCEPWGVSCYLASCLSLLAVLALFPWRWRKVSYAVSHERFPHAPHRDPRGHIVSVAYAAQLPRVALPKAGSDAMHAEWLDTREVTLGFDHACILADAKAKKTGFSQR